MPDYKKCKNCWWFKYLDKHKYVTENIKLVDLFNKPICYFNSRNIGQKNMEKLFVTSEESSCHNYTNRKKYIAKYNHTLEQWLKTNYNL